MSDFTYCIHTAIELSLLKKNNLNNTANENQIFTIKPLTFKR